MSSQEFKYREHQFDTLREEISAILSVGKPGETVLLRLENSGGAVHEHGLAASQLLRLKAHGLRLVIAVDKVAASGGYLMACIADTILAAPFAIVGSIGVLMQLPNLHHFTKGQTSLFLPGGNMTKRP